MAAKKKSSNKDLSRLGETASRSRKKAASMGEVVGPTSSRMDTLSNGKKRFQSRTTVYSKGGTGKGTTGKRGGDVVSVHQAMPLLPDAPYKSTKYYGRKISNIKSAPKKSTRKMNGR